MVETRRQIKAKRGKGQGPRAKDAGGRAQKPPTGATSPLKKRKASDLSPVQPPKKARRGKTGALNKLAATETDLSPMESLHKHHSKKKNDLLLGKVDPSRTGEHTPSAVSYNTMKSPFLRVLGRSHTKKNTTTGISEMKESDIPTFQFKDFQGRQLVDGKRAHSITTTLRQLGGVGEKDVIEDRDELLDRTLNSYQGGSHMLDHPTSPTKMQVELFNKNKSVRLTSQPVGTRVGQAIFNMYARQGMQPFVHGEGRNRYGGS